MSHSPAAPDEQPPPAGGRQAGPADEGLDWDLDFQQILNKPERRRRHRLPEMARKEKNPVSEKESAAGDAAEEDPPALKGPPGNRSRLERKSDAGTKNFTRFVTRPETAVAATVATGRAPAERVISVNGPSAPAFGKIRNGEEIDFAPNRLHNVINDAVIHSRLTWIDHLGQARTVFLGVLLAAVFAGLVWLFREEIKLKGNEDYIIQETAALLPADNVRQAAIRRAFDAYLAAPDPAARQPWVLEPERVGPRMKHFYLDRQEKDPALAGYKVGPPVRAGNEWWFTLDCSSPDGGKFTAIIKETPQGGRLDWENYVAYGSMPWGQFIDEKPTASQSLRARIRPSTHYAGKYTAEKDVAYEISHRAGPPVLHGYAPRASRTGQLLAALPKGANWKSVNIYLRWEADAGAADAVEIADIIRNNWLDTITSSDARQTAGASRNPPPTPPPSPAP